MSAWLPRFACPECKRSLAPDDLHCHPCACHFERRDHHYVFLTAARAEESARFHDQYRRLRADDGYRSGAAEYYRQLPAVAVDDARAVEWRIRRESYAHLLALLARGGSGGRRRVLDLGAGNGWLSHRLAASGHDVVAVDRLSDEADGLGAARHYPLPLVTVQADFDALPFEPGQFDVAVFNGSLHYSKVPQATLAEARRVLAPGGVVVVMDSPMFHGEAEGRAMLADQEERFRVQHGVQHPITPGVGFLTFDSLERAASALGVAGRFIRSRGPWLWRVRRQVSRVRLGRAPASFGVWVAQ